MSENPRFGRLAPTLARAALVVLLVAPAAARACPACIQSDQKARTAIPVVMSFLFVPFLIFGAAALMIFRQSRAARARQAAAIPTAVGPGRLIYLAEPSRPDDAARARRPAA